MKEKKMATNVDLIATFIQNRLKFTRTELKTSALKQLFCSDWRKDVKAENNTEKHKLVTSLR